jgi:hypothetical protein
MKTGLIERENWKEFLKDFNQRNAQRATRMEILGSDIGAEKEEETLPLTGISLEEKGSDAPRVEIMLGGETAKKERHLGHTVTRVRSIMSKPGLDLREEALLIEDEKGTKVILSFEMLPALEPA